MSLIKSKKAKQTLTFLFIQMEEELTIDFILENVHKKNHKKFNQSDLKALCKKLKIKLRANPTIEIMAQELVDKISRADFIKEVKAKENQNEPKQKNQTGKTEDAGRDSSEEDAATPPAKIFVDDGQNICSLCNRTTKERKVVKCLCNSPLYAHVDCLTSPKLAPLLTNPVCRSCKTGKCKVYIPNLPTEYELDSKGKFEQLLGLLEKVVDRTNTVLAASTNPPKRKIGESGEEPPQSEPKKAKIQDPDTENQALIEAYKTFDGNPLKNHEPGKV